MFKEDGIKSFITTSSHLFLLLILDKWIKIVNSENPNDFCIIDVSLATPVSQQVDIHPLFQRILERFPNAFPILRHLLGL